jgi:hypothetical protein
VSYTLDEIQSLFGRAIQDRTPVTEQAVAALVPGFATGSDRLSPVAQLDIYREQFWLRHVDALEEDFATIAHLLGHDEFHRLAERYLEAHPPSAFSLRDLGTHLPGFVGRASPYARDPFIADCARLEWAFVEAFDAGDAPQVDSSRITSVPEDAWPRAIVSFHPSVHLVPLSYPAHEYRAAVRAKESPARPVPRDVHVVIYRGGEMLQYIEIPALASALLARLSGGEPLGLACEAVAITAPGGEAEIEGEIGGWFQLWAAAGWIVGLDLPGSAPTLSYP